MENAEATPTMLSIRGVSKSFGGHAALSGVELDVSRSTIHGIIGPNGAGKTTLLNCVTRVYEVDEGDIVIDGASVIGLQSHQIMARGVARTFQQSQIVPELSVSENVMLGGRRFVSYHWWDVLLRTRRFQREEAALRHDAEQATATVGLPRSFLDRDVRSLTQEELGLVGIARALSSKPTLLLLDEPTAGMAGMSKQRVGEAMQAIREEGVTQVLIEHDLAFVRSVCAELTAFDFGSTIAAGTVDAVMKHPAVLEAYIGTTGARH